MLAGPIGVRARLHETGIDEAFQSGGKDVGRDSEASLEVGEPGDSAQERVSDDQEAPPLTDGLQGARHRAVLSVIRATQHGN
jgi:hypothetical protein